MTVLSTNVDRDRREIDVASRIALLEPDATPLTVILMRARKDPTNTAEFVWFEDENGARWMQINNAAGYVAGDTNLVVDDASIFAVADVVKVPRTAEVMRVTAVNTGTQTITVVRGWGTTAAAALVDNDWLLIIGNAMQENSSAPATKIGQPVKKNNFTQIIRTPFDLSATTDAEKQKTSEKERQRLTRKKGVEHRIDIERAVLFGEKKEDTTGGQVRRAMGGILSFITTNVYDAGGTLTESEFETSFCEMLFRYGSSRKLLLCAARVLSVINQFAAGKLQTVPRQEVYGLQVQRYLSAHGELLLAKSNLLEKEYGNHSLGLDIANITYRPLTGRDTKLKRNIQNNDVDGFMDEYLTEAGLKVELEKTHAILKNVTG